MSRATGLPELDVVDADRENALCPVPGAGVGGRIVTPHAQPMRFGRIHEAPVHMLPPERVLLYALVFGLRPERCLEVGTLHGGSAMITVAALDDVGQGCVVCVDPHPRVTPEVWSGVAHRATLIEGCSPDALPEARRVAGGAFDIALVDGDHGHDGVVRDLEGVMGVLTASGYILMHDAHYVEVHQGIDETLRAHAGRLVDCGMLSRAWTRDQESEAVRWGGIRVLHLAAPGSQPTASRRRFALRMLRTVQSRWTGPH